MNQKVMLLIRGTFIDWEMDQQISLSSVKRGAKSYTWGRMTPHSSRGCGLLCLESSFAMNDLGVLWTAS